MNKRIDGRTNTELRDIEAKVGVIKRANGSAYFRIGNTAAYAAVYGPRPLIPRFMQDPKKGILRCTYNMLPYSGMGDRVRPGMNRRAKEISMVTENALKPVILLDKFPNAVVDVYIELPQTDAGSRCAGICAASMALAHAGIPMKDLVSAVAVGKMDKELIVDLRYEEEAYDGEISDIPFAYIHNTEEICLLQMDGIIEDENLLKLADMAREAVKKIYEIQKKALIEEYDIKGDFNDSE